MQRKQATETKIEYVDTPKLLTKIYTMECFYYVYVFYYH